jgi:hypothetical protein
VGDELQYAEAKLQEYPSIDGFTSTVSGCVAELSKEQGDEKIVVKFDIHEGITVEDNEDGDHQYADDDEDRHSDGDDSEAEFEEEPLFIPSTFSVDIANQSSGQILHFECCVGPHNTAGALQIVRISFLPSSAGSTTDPSYSVDCSTLPMELYDGFMEYLTDRGITSSFVDELVHFHDVLEGHQYALFLRNTLSFVSH